jgi:adenylosuccinate lyase
MKRNLQRFQNVRKNIEVGKLSGAVGNFANNTPKLQTYVCKKLGIREANISTQVIQRDVYAQYFSTLALIGSTIEKIATEIRHLQRTEVGEAEEYFSKGQKGSSAMPHKRNPIASENMCGCARILRGYAFTSFENNALWHERDISHSSTERIMLPDATSLINYMLNRYANVLDKLIVYPEKMIKNINLTNGVIFAQRVMNCLITKGMSREQAYDSVQPLAMKSFETGIPFQELLLATETITKKVSKKELLNCFTLDYYLEKVPYIYKKVGLR